MTNQQFIFSAIVNAATAFANNSALKKYRDSCVFMIGCDGTGSSAVCAGDKRHIENHFYRMMLFQPEFAALIKTALDKAMLEPEVADKVLEQQRIAKADDIINRIIGDLEE